MYSKCCILQVDIHKHFATVFEDHCDGDKEFHEALKRAVRLYYLNGDSSVETGRFFSDSSIESDDSSIETW